MTRSSFNGLADDNAGKIFTGLIQTIRYVVVLSGTRIDTRDEDPAYLSPIAQLLIEPNNSEVVCRSELLGQSGFQIENAEIICLDIKDAYLEVANLTR